MCFFSQPSCPSPSLVAAVTGNMSLSQESVFIYLLDVESGRLLCDNPPHALLAEGKLR